MAQVPVSGRAGLDSLARAGFEVAAVREIAGVLHAVIVVDDRTEGLLRRQGLRVAPAPGFAAALAADTFKVYRSFDKPGVGIRATLQAWTAADTIFHLDSIGNSIEGRPILAVKIGNGSDSPSRPNVLFMATHHAREWVSTEMAMKLLRWIADSLPRSLLGARDIWVIPVENPDGYQYTFTASRLWRKNRRPNADGSFGVDPNRNYPAFWGLDNAGSSPTPGSEVYRGAGPASEPETQAIVSFHAAHPPVLAVSYHTFSGLVLHPYGFRAGELAPDLTLFQALAGTDLQPAVRDSVPFSSLTYYHPGPGWNLYPTNGEYTEWAYRAHGTITFTPELTSGCCTPDSGLYYHFVFPDDSALVERVFRDNLPFAVSVIAAAGNLETAQGASGLTPAGPRFESLWPESRLSLAAATPQPLSLSVKTATGSTVTRSAQGDSLWRGTIRNSWRTDLRTDTARALRADGLGVAAELLTLAGAEDTDVGWTGWARTPAAAAGSWAWTTSATDTLTSPVTSIAGRSRIWLHFWTRHSGTTFAPQQRGIVQFSPDGGTTWSDVAVFVGDGSSWYPVRVDLPAAAGATGARVRFVSQGFAWSVDVVGFASDSTAAFQSVPLVGDAQVSENPVRGNQVVIAWPLGMQAALVGIYTYTGRRLVAATVTPPNNEYVWDLTGGGRPVVNGAYIVVVDVDGRRFLRRLFVTRP
ncbi:MAG: zinc carboxypeptidase [Gemmatimonadetes bacterium]|nr:zinc carboxypeptidase [Gemmatimonadota bacterium]